MWIVLFREQKTCHPADGAVVWGLYLDGAAWDTLKGRLCDSPPGQRFCPLPEVHFRPSVVSSHITNFLLIGLSLFVFFLKRGEKQELFLLECDGFVMLCAIGKHYLLLFCFYFTYFFIINLLTYYLFFSFIHFAYLCKW